MTRRFAAHLIMPVALAFLAACGGEPAAPTAETALEHAGKHLDPLYQCPMHPDVTSQTPGSCPICGMDLVLATPSAVADEETIQVSAAAAANLGVRTGVVRRGAPGGSVETIGTAAFDERGRVELRVRAEGYVEQLAVRAPGERIRRGQLLFAVFSPRLAAAQGEYLQALRLGDEALVEAAAARLVALGMDRGAVAQVRETGRPVERVAYRAPVDGVVLELGVREGGLAEPGMSAMTIASTDPLWIIASVPEALAARVRPDAEATVSFPSLPGERFAARVLEILPALDEATRTAQVRLRLTNPAGRIAAGMRANVLFDPVVEAEVVLAPMEAVIRTGRADRVIVALGEGRFAPREVVTGREFDGEVEIRAGLEPGERVVTSGIFMLDSESQVRQGLRRLEAEDGGDAATGHDHHAHHGH
ncbi:MAG: efflux RND transporter periplasmic adaptor subunit [Steroidobacteraceae bacterium]|jgi:Cu(I)/Ag(I) efflux system membrane fusion protein|nr:efflux RND transporter periplasmic adaptor subunit [Steroidobacteraceae bacterium]